MALVNVSSCNYHWPKSNSLFQRTIQQNELACSFCYVYMNVYAVVYIWKYIYLKIKNPVWIGACGLNQLLAGNYQYEYIYTTITICLQAHKQLKNY